MLKVLLNITAPCTTKQINLVLNSLCDIVKIYPVGIVLLIYNLRFLEVTLNLYCYWCVHVTKNYYYKWVTKYSCCLIKKGIFFFSVLPRKDKSLGIMSQKFLMLFLVSPVGYFYHYIPNKKNFIV